ncbi:hypothetical protein [Streptomyces cahuitamycinicus]|uniref:Uncharacterized protein n=1 Tax=Streptomyces cahuitamycinicus TaxID=2070367 RepID=A0A2N8TTU9_9ACTN|nr:hypothetical protein [Streptomyces cahuitamycinicus]PNG22420.1 hypothetical protein C1J00_09450 [Streptomyces cahuitamycinicus]
MSSFNLDEREKAKQFAAFFKQFEDRLAALERANQLNHASIEGGSLDIYDEEGTFKGSVGVQPDGGVALVPDPVSTEPPPTPTAPIVQPALAGLLIAWDGGWGDASQPPSDFALVQVHVGTTEAFTPDVTTQVATITAPLGGSVTVHIEGYDPAWVCLVAANTAVLTGDPSPKVQGQARQAVSEDVVDGMVTEVKLAESAVTAAKIALGAVGTTALADGAVLEDKLAKAAVTLGKIAEGAVTLNALGGALSDSAAQRYVDAMGDPAAWTVTDKGTGAAWDHLSGITDAPTGQTVGQAAGYNRLLGTTVIPYEPGVLYRLSARVRLIGPAGGTDSFYVGVAGIGADGQTLVNRNGIAGSPSSHYYVAASGKAITTADGWVQVIGFLNGRAEAGAAGSAGPNNDPRAAGLVHADVRFIAPYVWLCYSGAGVTSTSVMQVDCVTLEALKTGVVDSVNLVAGSVTTAALAADSVTAGKVAADAISARELKAGSVTASELSAGSVTTPAIAAGTITADKLTIVGSPNVLPDPSFEGAGGAAIAARYTYTVQDLAFGNGSPASLKIDAASATAVTRAAELTLLPVLPGDQVYVATDYYPSATWVGTEINAHVRWEKADGTVLSYSKLANTAPAKGAWARFAGTVTAPADAVQGRVRVESLGGTAGAVWFDNAAVRPVVPGVQIADGAITAPKILAGAITTDKLAALSITAEKIAALAITTDKLAALSITADKLAVNSVTATNIAAGAIEATHIKAGAITTSALAADAITGKTITGGAINGATVTGGVLRTAASGQRVVIEPGGSNEVGSVKFYSGSATEGAPGQVVTNIALWSDASGSWEVPSVSLLGPQASGSEQRTGLYLAPRVPGKMGAGFNLYANEASGVGVAQINAYAAESSAVGSSLELSVRDAPPGSAAASVRLTSSGLTVTGVLKADSMATGRVSITPSAANTPTPVSVTGLNLQGSNFRVVATPSTSVPGTAVTGVGVTNASATGFTIWLTRTNTTTTSVDWIVVAS